ncbi:MAG: flavin reductase family protein [Beijerinckiaceae bacterium]
MGEVQVILGETLDLSAYAGAADPAHFREAMSRLPAAVHVVTTDGVAGLGGITASAVSSVTVEPPMMLFCINKSSPSTIRVIQNGVFCINTLAPGDQGLSDVFAGRTGQDLEEKFAAAGDWIKLATGAPVLATALLAFDCRLIEARQVSTHFVMIGIAEAVKIAAEGEALMYAHRKYKAF